MKNFLNSMIAWAPDGTGVGDDAAAAAAAAAAAGGKGGDDDAAAAAAAAAAAGKTTNWWDDLDPALKGTDEKTTKANVLKLSTDLKGYRDRDASRDVPADAKGYLNFENLGDFKIDPKNKPHFDILANDPAFKVMAEVSHQEGIGRKTLFKVYQAGLNAMQEAGLLEAPLDAAAEMAALIPDAAKSLPKVDQDTAVQKRMNENYSFLSLMQTNKALPKEVSDYAEMMLGDSAKGHQFLEWVRGQVQGGGAGPGAHGAGAGGDTRESLRAEMAALENNKNDPNYKANYAALEEKYKKMFPDTQ